MGWDSMKASPQAAESYGPIRKFVHEVQAACERSADVPSTVEQVKNRLSALIEQAPPLPDRVRETNEACYGRHFLYGDPDGRFEMVIMTWSPGQATPVHDHAGIWCVEGVLEGLIDVTRYDLTEKLDDNLVRLRSTEVIHAGLGQCGALIPPVEYHSISNPYDRQAVSLHVYGGRMRNCRVYEQRGDGLYEVGVKKLSFASPLPALEPLPV
jgi:predicted metal-dependent enzyme (double-stranded beta helix superfamily)